MDIREPLDIKGKVELFVTKGKPTLKPVGLLREYNGVKVYADCEIDFSDTEKLREETLMNIIFNQGKDTVINSLTSGFIKVIARMAIGDRGTIPSDQTVPKVPTATMTELYNEISRSDVDVTTLNIGTPTVHEVKFIKTFSALEIPVTAFSNQAKPLVNEVALVLCDLLVGNPLPRPTVHYPGVNDADEQDFSMRTFKSVPFEAANEIAITIRYTIFIQ